VPFGLSTSYSPDWLGRFQGIDSEVKTLNVNPSISYKISDTASIGAGVSYQHGEIDLLTAVNFGSAAAEGQSRVGIKGDAWGFNVGGLFNVGPATRLGIHYRSSLSYDMDGNIRFTGIPAAVQAGAPTLTDSNVKMSFSTPDSFAFSLVHKLNDRWELLGDVMYWRWSKIKRIQLVRDGAASSGATQDTLTFNFDDSWRLSAGAHYKLNPSWTLKLGAAYDQSPVPNAESRTVRLPDNDRIWLTVGAKYQMSRAGALDIGYAYIKVRNADINHTAVTTVPTRGTVNGTYKADVHVIGVQYQHTF
jgi:long-chain fatty acid transport protein